MIPVEGGPIIDRVDVLEVNHVYDQEGSKIFTQLIGWDFHPPRRPTIVFWRLMKERHGGMYPRYDHHARFFYSTWHDGDTLRTVRSGGKIERWLQHDVEIREREHQRKEDRRGLTDPAAYKPIPVEAGASE